MKHFIKKCSWILVCLCLTACGSKTPYLEEVQEIPQTEAKEASSVSGQKEDAQVQVYVCGEVVAPGVYRLDGGTRICDAVEAAGGFTEKASREYWNLAEPLTDGQMIFFPTEEEAKERKESAERAGAFEQESDSRININTANVAELTAIPGIGETRAEAIVAYRLEHGDFSQVEDIMKVSGIKNALFEKMKEYITIR